MGESGIAPIRSVLLFELARARRKSRQQVAEEPESFDEEKGGDSAHPRWRRHGLGQLSFLPTMSVINMLIKEALWWHRTRIGVRRLSASPE